MRRSKPELLGIVRLHLFPLVRNSHSTTGEYICTKVIIGHVKHVVAMVEDTSFPGVVYVV